MSKNLYILIDRVVCVCGVCKIYVTLFFPQELYAMWAPQKLYAMWFFPVHCDHSA